MTPCPLLPPSIPSTAGHRRHHLRVWAGLAVLATCLVTNATAAALKTSTGKPEVLILTRDKAAVFDRLADLMLSNNYMLKGRNENIAVFGQSKNTLSGEIEYRVTYNLIDTTNGLRVMATMGQYVYPNTPREKLDIDLSRHPKMAPSYQALLESLRATMPAPQPPPQPQGQTRAQAMAKLEETVDANTQATIEVLGLVIAGSKVVALTPDRPAEKAGLKPGDLLVSIDGAPATTTLQNGPRLNGRTDTSVLVVVKRGDQLLKLPIIREKSPE